MPLNYQEPECITCSSTLIEYIQAFQLISDSNGYISYLIDHESNFLALSHGFMQHFKIKNKKQLIDKSYKTQRLASLKTYQKFADLITEQNNSIIQTKAKRIFLNITFSGSVTKAMFAHRTPIFDMRGNLLCIHVLNRPFIIARLANLGAKFHNIRGFPTKKSEMQSISLTRIQQMVLYLYARNYSYTDISVWLNRIGQKTSPEMVNKHLNNLKKLFDVRDKESLKDMSLKLGYDVAVPAEFFPEGIHDVTDDIFDLWVC